MMEDKKLENKYAMHLSGILKGAGFEQGVNLLRALPCVHSEPEYYFEALDSAFGYKFRNECYMSIDGIGEWEIDLIYFRLEINATHDEMVDLLEDNYEYDEEWDEDELTRNFWDAFNDMCEEMRYDELIEKFEDKRICWDVTLNDGRYYCDGELKEHY